MKNPRPFLVLLTAGLLIFAAGCAHTRYYAPVLLCQSSTNPNQYEPVAANGILIPRSSDTNETYWTVEIGSIHPGFMHRELQGKSWSKRGKANFYKDKDIWVFLEVEGLPGNDLFETKVDKKAAFSHVVLNAASYDTVLVDIPPIPLFPDKVYRVKTKLYVIDKYLIRKVISQAKDQSLGKWVTDSVGGFFGTLDNALCKELFTYYQIVTDQNYPLEQLLLTVGASIEFNGAFDIVPSNAEKTNIVNHLALYDYFKSEVDTELFALAGRTNSIFNTNGVIIPPSGRTEYNKDYLAVRANHFSLTNDLEQISAIDPERISRFQSYIKFTVSPSGRPVTTNTNTNGISVIAVVVKQPQSDGTVTNKTEHIQRTIPRF